MNNQIDILPTLIRKAARPEKLTEYPNEEYIRPAIKQVCQNIATFDGVILLSGLKR